MVKSPERLSKKGEMNMAEVATPLDKLRRLGFSVSALAQINSANSYEGELARIAAEGIKRELDWVIANLEAAGEGLKNMGLTKF